MLLTTGMKSLKRFSKKVVWALDPYEAELMPDQVCLEILKSQFQGDLKKVIPVYVAKDISRADVPDIAKKMTMFISRFTSDSIGKPIVLSAKSKSKVTPVKKLLRYTKLMGARFIAVSSSGKRGVKRLLLGSFAEELLKESSVPLLFLTHNEASSFSSKKVLYATDFSKKSMQAYREFLKFSKNFAYKVILYHLVTDPMYNLTAATNALAGVPTYFPQDLLEQQRRWAEDVAKDWIRLTKASLPNVEVDFILQESLTPVGNSILNIAEKEDVGFIGLSSSVNLIEKTFLGSVAQEVFRAQSRPVWVCGPKFKG